MRRTLGVSLCVFVFILGSACNWRKPLPRGKDAGPPVEVVDAKPTNFAKNLPGSGPTAALSDEHEPNDDRQHAQPFQLSSGISTGIRGSLAPPTALGAGKGNDDWFSMTTSDATALPELLHIELSGSPEADLSLDLYDGNVANGSSFAHIDEHGRGGAERLGLSVRPHQTLLMHVRGNVAQAGGPELSAYKLVVTPGPAPLGSEVEPNDTPEQATPAVAADLSGTLPWRGDEDFWVLNLADALYRRPPVPGARPQGLKADAILRIELRSPGATPALRLLIEPEAAANNPDGGTAGFRKLKFLLELSAEKGSQELRLRNVGLPAGSARAFIGVKVNAPPVAKGNAEPRYQLRLSVEPPLEDAESEPNDDCAQANVLSLTAPAGGPSEGAIAGFLWPGDNDCFRIAGSATARRHSVELLLPGAGSDCRAALAMVPSEGMALIPAGKDAAANTLVLHGKGDALLSVKSRDHGKGCFDAPYRLTVRSEPDRP